MCPTPDPYAPADLRDASAHAAAADLRAPEPTAALDLGGLRAEVDTIARALARIQCQLAEVDFAPAPTAAPPAVAPASAWVAAPATAGDPSHDAGSARTDADRRTPASPALERRGAAVPLLPTPVAHGADARPASVWARFVADGAWRRPDWWLSRFGVGFLVLGVGFLLAMSLERRLLGPAGRCLAALALGAALAIWGARTARPAPRRAPALPRGTERPSPRRAGVRDLLYGGALAIWFGTSYAAYMRYQLISLEAAEAAMLAVAALGTALGWRERQEALAVAALVGAYGIPLLVPTPAPSPLLILSYAAALAQLALWLYVRRAWRFVAGTSLAGSILFAALALPRAAAPSSSDLVRAATLALLAVLGVAQIAAGYLRYAHTPRAARPPLDPRDVFADGIAREVAHYVAHEADRDRSAATLAFDDAAPGTWSWSPFEHHALFLLPVLVPVAVAGAALDLWPAAGAAPFARILYALAVAVGIALWRTRTLEPVRPFRPVACWAAGTWAVCGLMALTPSRRANAALLATHAALLALAALRRGRIAVARGALATLATVALLFTTVVVLTSRTDAMASGRAEDLRITAALGLWVAGLALGTGALGWWWHTRATGAERNAELHGASALASATLLSMLRDDQTLARLAVGGYAAALLHARLLVVPITEALATALWASAGVACLAIAAHLTANARIARQWPRGGPATRVDPAWLRRTGLATCFVVAAKLLLVDLAEAETGWRILVCLGCGALFVGVSRWLADGRDAGGPEPNA